MGQALRAACASRVQRAMDGTQADNEARMPNRLRSAYSMMHVRGP